MGDAEQELSQRLQQFRSDVDNLKLVGGRADVERRWMVAGVVAMIGGVVLSLVGWIGTQATESDLEFADYAAMSRFGIAVTIAGSTLFTVMSLRRWFRFWLLRLIYELRGHDDY